MGRSSQVAAILDSLAGEDPEVVRRVLQEFAVRDQAAALAARETAGNGNGGSQPISSPLDIDDCVLWLDASQLGLADDAAVSAWPDLSGEGNNFAQADADLQPIYKTAAQNGLGVVRFTPDTDSKYLDAVAGALDMLQDKPGATLAIVMGNLDQSANLIIPFWASDNGDSTSQRLYYTFNDFGVRQTDGGTLTQVGGPPSFLSGWGWCVGRANLASGLVVVSEMAGQGGGQYATDPPVQANFANTASDLIRVGDKDTPDPAASAVIGDIGEIVVYDRCLTTGETRELQAYLSAKWATP